MATFQDFINTVKRAVRRGNSMDGDIPFAIQDAIRFIERDYDLPYMRRTLTFNNVTNEVEIVGNDGRDLKLIERVRWEDDDGNYVNLIQVDPDQLAGSTGEYPQGYLYFEELSSTGDRTVRLELDTFFEPAESVTVIGTFYTFVDPTNTSAANVWLINYASDVLLARTMIQLAPIMRDPVVLQMYQALWAEGQKTLLTMASELKQGAR